MDAKNVMDELKDRVTEDTEKETEKEETKEEGKKLTKITIEDEDGDTEVLEVLNFALACDDEDGITTRNQGNISTVLGLVSILRFRMEARVKKTIRNTEMFEGLSGLSGLAAMLERHSKG